jgi:subtilisin family serine protease
VWSQSNTGADVGLVAPGVDIYRDDNQGRQGYSDGTSEATAYVSAAAALVRSAHPTWTAPEVVAALIATADKPAAMHGAVRTDQYGYGILDVLAALRLSEPPPVGGMASPDPVKSAGAAKVATEGRSGSQMGLAFGAIGGGLAVVVAGLGALGLARRRVAGRRHG